MKMEYCDVTMETRTNPRENQFFFLEIDDNL